MKKILFLSVFILLFMSGCSVTYDLYIGEKLTDNIFLYDDNDILKNLDYYDMEADTELNFENYSFNIGLFEEKFNYKREEYGSSDVSGYNYNYTYNYDKMNKKSMIYDCYDEIKVDREKTIFIETSDTFKCFDKYSLLDDVTVNIHYNGTLISTNADTYNDGVYTWFINEDNYKNKKIYLELEKDSNNVVFEIVGGIVFGVLILVSIIFIKKYKKKAV